MRRRQITLDEQIDARFVRRSAAECWWWEGSLKEGRPAINLRHVMRYIYEREIAPIPPNMTLARRDHGPDCMYVHPCRHLRCVNPYHVVPTTNAQGLYERENDYAIGGSERTMEWKRRVRANRRRKEEENDGTA